MKANLYYCTQNHVLKLLYRIFERYLQYFKTYTTASTCPIQLLVIMLNSRDTLLTAGSDDIAEGRSGQFKNDVPSSMYPIRLARRRLLNCDTSLHSTAGYSSAPRSTVSLWSPWLAFTKCRTHSLHLVRILCVTANGPDCTESSAALVFPWGVGSPRAADALSTALIAIHPCD